MHASVESVETRAFSAGGRHVYSLALIAGHACRASASSHKGAVGVPVDR